MDILHYLNVIIGFSLVMLILSIVTSFTAQIWLVIWKTKARAVGKGLKGLLEDVGVEKESAKQNVNEILDTGNSIFGKKLGGIISRISAFFWAGTPRNVGREEFLLLLLRKAKFDEELAKKLGFPDATEANKKLEELEKRILTQEADEPMLAAQVWRTKAMQKVVPELASKIFARFDDVMDRATEEVSAFGKLLVVIITLPVLLVLWPVNSVDLINRLSNDKVLSEKVAGLAEGYVKQLQTAGDSLLKCKEKHDPSDNCEKEAKEQSTLANNMFSELNRTTGLFGSTMGENNKIECSFFGFLKSWFPKECKRAELTPGIFVTWILVSLGSAFWLGLLNQVLGIRSEFGKKLEEQRSFRATSQQ